MPYFYLLAFSCIDDFFCLRVYDSRPIIALILDKGNVPIVFAFFFRLSEEFDVTLSVKRIVGKRGVNLFLIMRVRYLQSVFAVALVGTKIGKRIFEASFAKRERKTFDVS